MGVPYTNVTGDLRQANYSSLREGSIQRDALAAVRPPAIPARFAQTQIGGIITLKLSDPSGASEPWRVQRQLLRSWPGMRSCEAQKMSLVGFHVGQVEGHDLITASGASPVVEVESIECFTSARTSPDSSGGDCSPRGAKWQRQRKFPYQRTARRQRNRNSPAWP